MTIPASGESLVNIGGQELFMALDGPVGAPWLVFSNSLATDLHLWDAQVETLAREWRILRYDYRGHGKSKPSISPACTICDLKGDLLGLMNCAGVGRAHHIGVSMGSVAGAAAALEQPHRFASLTLCNCRLRSSDGATRNLKARADRAREAGMHALADMTLEKWFGCARLPLDESTRLKVSSMIAATQDGSFAAYAEGMKDYDVEAIVTQQSVPVCILVGSDDGEIASHLSQLRGSRRDVTFASVERAGHLPNIHAPQEFTAALMQFLHRIRQENIRADVMSGAGGAGDGTPRSRRGEP
jgi:3-oxoadipate enol-lactonase